MDDDASGGTHTWSSQRSLELSRQMASYASPSKEMTFLYKALGTSLAACEDLVLVKSQIHTLLNSYRQQIIWKPLRDRIISILTVCAESHLDLTLNALQELGAAVSKVKISGFIGRLKVRLPPWDKRQDSQHPDADIQQRGCPCSKKAASILSRGRHHRERPSPLQNQLSGAGHRCYKQGLPEANPVSRVVSRPCLRQSNGRQSFRAFFLCGRHTKASMEAAQLTLAIRSTLNTTLIIQQYMQHWNLAKRYQARRRRQRGHVSDQDMDTDFSESMGPANACIMVLMGQVHAVERRFWARETSTDWWDRIVLQVWDDSQWLRNFRMRKGTFMELCDLLSPALKRMNTKMRAALTVEKRVAIALWKLATPDSYRSVGNQFGVGKSTVGAAVMQVAHAIKDLLISRLVTLGNVQVIVDGFAAMGFPNCGGAIDGTHIPILAPEHQATEYINRKGYFSIVLQALVDHKGRFTNINVGWPGKVHDARIFRNSGLFQNLQEGTLFPDQKITVGDVEMPIVILGDPAYPLMPWLMKPYTGSLDSSQELFNYRLSKCKMVVQCAFGRLKARWCSLLTRLDLSKTNIPTVITACCVLHNICESKGEMFMATV
ncbi:unnamed protein product [Eretmochelys imbricata]